jgi:hypothetical protein
MDDGLRARCHLNKHTRYRTTHTGHPTAPTRPDITVHMDMEMDALARDIDQRRRWRTLVRNVHQLICLAVEWDEKGGGDSSGGEQHGIPARINIHHRSAWSHVDIFRA